MIHLFQFFGELTGVNLREERSECRPETFPGPFCTPREDYTSEVSAAFVEVAWVLIEWSGLQKIASKGLWSLST